MDERLVRILNVLRKHADRIMVAALLLALGIILSVYFTEEVQVQTNPTPMPYTLKPMIPNPDYNAALTYLNLNPRIDQVADGKYQDLQIFNPFDKQIIRIGEEIERKLNQLVKDAREAERAGEYQRCIDICVKILSQDFNRVEAKEMRKRCQEKLAPAAATTPAATPTAAP